MKYNLDIQTSWASSVCFLHSVKRKTKRLLKLQNRSFFIGTNEQQGKNKAETKKVN